MNCGMLGGSSADYITTVILHTPRSADGFRWPLKYIQNRFTRAARPSVCSQQMLQQLSIPKHPEFTVDFGRTYLPASVRSQAPLMCGSGVISLFDAVRGVAMAVGGQNHPYLMASRSPKLRSQFMQRLGQLEGSAPFCRTPKSCSPVA